jgi:ribose transport system substrate-binding protein
MVGMFAYQPPILLDVLRSAQKLGAVQIVAFDEDAQTLQGIVDGHVHATVVQDPYEYGRQSILLLDRLHKAADEPQRAAVLPKNGVLDVPVRALRKADVPGFQQDLAKKLGKK